MASQGLQSSAWAPHNLRDSHRGSYKRTPYNTSKPRAVVAESSKHTSCAVMYPPPANYSPYPVDLSLRLPRRAEVETGLRSSVWAPHNQSRRKRPHVSQIWSRIDPAQDLLPQESLSLPYEVQHCILIIIQRICEQGCYDFASHWIPRTLTKNKWTCPEAVEMSTWRALLPVELPQEALSVQGNEKLQIGLKDAVYIRNAATHRHICDNYELRKAASQAQGLMVVLSDFTRAEKLVSLKAQLSAWEASMATNYDAAKQTLLDALREIGERPVDDMDWTPNSVSMEEHPDEQLAAAAPLQWADHMDVD